jgi:hypothetical protein
VCQFCVKKVCHNNISDVNRKRFLIPNMHLAFENVPSSSINFGSDNLICINISV